MIPHHTGFHSPFNQEPYNTQGGVGYNANMNITMIADARPIHCVDVGAFPDLPQLLIPIDPSHQILKLLIIAKWDV
jgi:hypothetical protein